MSGTYLSLRGTKSGDDLSPDKRTFEGPLVGNRKSLLGSRRRLLHEKAMTGKNLIHGRGEERERGRRSSAREGESYLSTKWGYAR
jgi:hypothetical protein